jgi:choline-sulfatase
MHGSHGLLGKCNLYEGAIAVPLLMAGPGIPEGMVVDEITSHVDLFPTLVESSGVAIDAVDASLPGKSLWPALDGATEQRVGFAEYHAAMSLNGSFMLREGDLKLIYHVDMPCQLFDLAHDPDEVEDLAGRVEMADTVARLETQLRAICNPETVDRQAKADQFAKMGYWGGKAAVLAEGQLVITPPPGIEVENAWR